MNTENTLPYLHGFSEEEQRRLRFQAGFAEHTVYQDVNLSETSDLLEVGCGVGAQTEILLRRFPNINITGIDLNENQLAAARTHLSQLPFAKDRVELLQMNAGRIDFDRTFDGAFLCWVLEHVADPVRTLSEVRGVLRPGGVIYVTEVMNHTFFLDPYSPNVWKFWQAYNDYQYEHAGDPFVGAKLGNNLSSVGFGQVNTRMKSWHWDNRQPVQRKKFIAFWMELMMSGAQQLLDAGAVTDEVIDLARQEFAAVLRDPNGVFMYSFMQAHAVRI